MIAAIRAVLKIRLGAAIIVVMALGIVLGLTATWLRVRHRPPTQSELIERRARSQLAYQVSYLGPAAGETSPFRTACVACHTATNRPSGAKWDLLAKRSGMSREAWSAAIPLQTKCGLCHAVPDPATLPASSWIEVFPRMDFIMKEKNAPTLAADDRMDALHFYLTFSPERMLSLAPDPDPVDSPLRFDSSVFGDPKSPDSRQRPIVGHVQIIDLDRDGHVGVLVSDIANSQVSWIHRIRGVWQEDLLAKVPLPTHTQVVSNAVSGAWDIVVASQRRLAPSDDPVGSVVLLVNDGKMHFTTKTLVDSIGRVADVEPGDFNGDGRIDFLVADYGFINRGEVGWLEAVPGTNYLYHTIIKRTGAIHVPPADLNGDGRLDFVALFAQEHEQISAFINDGHGNFEERLLFKAATPSFGSSGIQLVDLDQDGDLDILYTNGDNTDLPTVVPRPFHGVQWLENKGNLSFVWHDITRFYGAYSAVAADLNRDGHLDIVVTSMFNDWDDPERDSVMWLENDGRQNFTPHGIARNPIDLISAAVGDLNEDGWPDIVAGGFHILHTPPFERTGRITLWTCRSPRQ